MSKENLHHRHSGNYDEVEIVRNPALAPIKAIKTSTQLRLSAKFGAGSCSSLVGRMFRREPLIALQLIQSMGLKTVAPCDSAWKVALSAALCVKAFELLDCFGYTFHPHLGLPSFGKAQDGEPVEPPSRGKKNMEVDYKYARNDKHSWIPAHGVPTSL